MTILRELQTEVKKEDLTPQVDGIATVFTTANDFKAQSLVVHLSGLLQREGATEDYTITGTNQITFVKAPKIGMTLHVGYILE